MGASYYLIPEETESELFSPRLAYIQLGVMLLAGVGTLLSFWFLRWSEGKPFTEAPQPWPWVIALGVVLFLVNIGITIFRARRWTAIAIVLFVGMVGLALMYLVNFGFKPNLTVDYFWWWWTIHLWVEGAWELITASILAFVLISITGVDRTRLNKYLYAEVALTLFTGVIGTGHHYYWIGTPDYWLFWGALFSALEPVPIALMTFDALTHMTHSRLPVTNRVAWFWIGGAAIGHLVGAGIWGFAQTLPQINQWTHGTQITASHGHFAFFGAFATIVLAAIYFMLPKLKGLDVFSDHHGLWAFWLMVSGMIIMVLSFAAGGIVQVYLNRIIGLDFMTVRIEHVSFWLFWVFIAGALLFLPGVLVYLWDFFFCIRRKPQVQS
jgi:nitric oxide reductase subunit B